MSNGLGAHAQDVLWGGNFARLSQAGMQLTLLEEWS